MSLIIPWQCPHHYTNQLQRFLWISLLVLFFVSIVLSASPQAWGPGQIAPLDPPPAEKYFRAPFDVIIIYIIQNKNAIGCWKFWNGCDWLVTEIMRVVRLSSNRSRFVINEKPELTLIIIYIIIHVRSAFSLVASCVLLTALSQLISISLFLEGEGGLELAEQ